MRDLRARHFGMALLLSASFELAALAFWLDSPLAPGTAAAAASASRAGDPTGVRLSLRSASTAAHEAPAAKSPVVVPVQAKAPSVTTPERRTPTRVPLPDVAAAAPEVSPSAADADDVSAQARSVTPASDGVADSRRGSEDSGSQGAGPQGGADAIGLGGDYFAALSDKVSRILARRYPKRARRLGVEGTVILALRLERTGSLATLTLQVSSGSSELDRHALRTVERAAPFGRVPDAIHDSALEFEFPLEYRLRD